MAKNKTDLAAEAAALGISLTGDETRAMIADLIVKHKTDIDIDIDIDVDGDVNIDPGCDLGDLPIQDPDAPPPSDDEGVFNPNPGDEKMDLQVELDSRLDDNSEPEEEDDSEPAATPTKMCQGLFAQFEDNEENFPGGGVYSRTYYESKNMAIPGETTGDETEDHT